MVQKTSKEKIKLPAIPPNDYTGSIADWMVALIRRGLMKEDDFYGDIWITEDDYGEILNECEGGEDAK